MSKGYPGKGRNHIRMSIATISLSLLVIFATAYALILPGMTLEVGPASESLEITSVPEASEVISPAPGSTQAAETAEATDAAGAPDMTPVPGITETPDTTIVPVITGDPASAADPAVTGMPEVSTAPVTTPEPYVFEDEKIVVTAIPDASFSIPDGAVFQASEITPESDPARYESLLGLVSENAAADVSIGSEPSGIDVLAYDIGFFVNGVETEPLAGSVTITISYKTPELTVAKPENLTLFHVVEKTDSVSLEPVAESAPIVSEDGTVESVSFEADSFSPYLITNGYTMSSSLHYSLIDQTSELFTNTSYYNASSPLGVAGSFHIVAFDTLTLSAHTNGNFMAKNLWASTNFGTNNFGAELSYVQNYLQVTSTDAADMADVLVVGSGNTVSLVDNGNAFAVNGTKIDKPQTIWQDNDTAAMPFIDMAAARTKVLEVNAMLATQKNTNMTSSLTTSGDPTNSYLTLTNVDKTGVYNFTASQLMSYSNGFSVRGFTAAKMGSVIINIDCAGQTTVNVPKIRMYIDGNNMPLSEMTTFTSGKILLNFVNAAGVNLIFNETYASVLAPDSNITSNQNLNGTIIGRNVTIKAESHRTDFTGSLPPTGNIKATKTWKAVDGSTLTGTAIADLSCSVQLYCNNAPMAGAAYTVTLNAANSWTYQWTYLPLDSSQLYSVHEVSISKGGTVIQTGETTAKYAVTYTNNAGIATGNIQITNTVATGTITVNKIWYAEDGSLLTGSAASSLSVTVQLYCNNTPMTGPPFTVTLSSANSFSYTWTDLAITSGQKYSVREAPYAGYKTTYLNNNGLSYGTITVNNTRGHPDVLPETGSGGTDGFHIIGGFLLVISLIPAVLIRHHRKRRDIRSG